MTPPFRPFPSWAAVTRRRSALAAIVVASVATLPTTAAAGTYRVDQCRTGAAIPTGVSTDLFRGLSMSATNNCGAGGGQLELRAPDNTVGDDNGGNQFAGFEFRIPASLPNTRISYAAATMSISGKTGAIGQFGLYDGLAAVNTIPVPLGAWGGFTDQTYGGTFSSRVGQFLVGCNGPCLFSTTPTMSVRRVVLDLYEEQPPATPTFATSGLLDGTPQRGVGEVGVSSADADSGVERLEIRTRGGAALATITPPCFRDRPAPCPQQRLNDALQVDTTRLPDGPQSLEVWVTDAANNLRVTDLPTFTVANGSAPTPVPVPAATPAPTPTPVLAAGALTFTVSSARPRRGMSLNLTGRLRPAPTVPQRVIIEARSGKRWITAAVVKTRAEGAFRWSHRFRSRGTYRMRARLLASPEAKLKPVTSPTRTFKVR